MNHQPLCSLRLFISDRVLKIRYLVDSGSDVTVILFKYVRRVDSPAKFPIVAANGKQIFVHGIKVFNFDFGFRRVFTWTVVVANVTHPIIGADFLEHFH